MFHFQEIRRTALHLEQAPCVYLHTMIARILIAVGTALACGPPGTTLGGFCPIDANDPLVQEIAQFAVSTHASRTNAVNDGSISVDHAWSQVRNFSHENCTLTEIYSKSF